MGRRERESKKKRKERKARKHNDKGELKRIGEWSVGWLEPMAGAGRALAFAEPDGVTAVFHERPGDPPLSVVSGFHTACADPIFGPPRRPRRVRTSDESLADRMREVSNLTVVVGPTPELVTFQEKLRKELALQSGALDPDAVVEEEHDRDEDDEDAFSSNDERNDEELLLPADLPEGVLKEFYSAAAALDEPSLWTCVRDGQFMEVRVAGFEELGPKFVLPLHGDGQPQAVLVLHSREDAAAYDDEHWGEVIVPLQNLTMLYEPIDELTAVGRERLERWQPPGHDSDAFMNLRRFEAGNGPPLAPTAAEVRLATSILSGLHALFASHAEIVGGPREKTVTLRVEVPALEAETASKGVVEFVLPAWDGTPAEYADLTDEDFDEEWEPPADPELEAALTRLATAGRNAPCPCGSNKKYKKCHFIEDQDRRHGIEPALRRAGA